MLCYCKPVFCDWILAFQTISLDRGKTLGWESSKPVLEGNLDTKGQGQSETEQQVSPMQGPGGYPYPATGSLKATPSWSCWAAACEGNKTVLGLRRPLIAS